MVESGSPMARYRQDLNSPGFVYDKVQEQAVEYLQALYIKLAADSARVRPWWKPLYPKRRRSSPVRGLYFWGGVGRGKTYLMDSFYESLPFGQKLRVHFHRFMQRVHLELREAAGEKNPLELVADRISREARVLCFDEFFVSDIADAMIMAGLLKGLFQRGVCLVATSNIEPEGLYKDGLQRVRFLPAIGLLQEHTQVFNLDGGIDYRLRLLEKACLYHSPLGAEADQSLKRGFDQLVPDNIQVSKNIFLQVEGRELKARAEAEEVVWFDFPELCDGPRSQNDYIELARVYHTVLVSNIPCMKADQDDLARRFINMVDEFYDRGVKLIISAAVPVERLYVGDRLAFEFDRTLSRLLEMQSHDYLSLPHRP